MSLQDAMISLQQKKQAIASQNAIRDLYAQPGALDGSGNLTPQSMAKVMQLNPAMGMELQENAIRLQTDRTKLQEAQIKRHDEIQGIIDPVRDSALNAYDEVIKAGGSTDAAQQAGQRAMDEGLTPLKSGGLLSDTEKSQLRSKFDYLPMRSMALSYKERQAGEVAARKTKVEEEKQATAEKREETFEKSVTSQIAARDTKTAAASQGEIDDETATKMARQYLTGDTSVMQNIGRGAQSGANIAKVRRAIYAEADKQNMAPEEIAAKVAEFQGIKAGERTLGTRTANIGMAVNEAKQLAPLALQASDKVDRTRFPTLNSVLLSAEKGLGGEDVVRLGVATNSLINIYSRAISPTGVPTVSDKEHARELLSDAWAKGQYRAGVDQMILEMNAASKSPGQTRAEFREAVKEGVAPVSNSLPQVTQPSAAPSQQFETGKVYRDAKGNKAKWDGTKFIDVQ